MKEIRDSQERQVQPVDFSFLSQADSEIVAGVEAMLRTMYGWQEDIPIILSGMIAERYYKPPQEATYNITAGKVLFKGKIMDFQQISNIPEPDGIDNILEVITWQTLVDIAAPSPVRDRNGEETINCHYEYSSKTMRLQNKLTEKDVELYRRAGVFLLSDMYRVEKMATYLELYNLQRRIEILEAK